MVYSIVCELIGGGVCVIYIGQSSMEDQGQGQSLTRVVKNGWWRGWEQSKEKTEGWGLTI